MFDTGIPTESLSFLVREGWNYPNMRFRKGESGKTENNEADVDNIGLSTRDIVLKSKKKKTEAKDATVARLNLPDKLTNVFKLEKKAAGYGSGRAYRGASGGIRGRQQQRYIRQIAAQQQQMPQQQQQQQQQGLTRDDLRESYMGARKAEGMNDVDVYQQATGQDAPLYLKLMNHPMLQNMMPYAQHILGNKWGGVAQMAFPIVSHMIRSGLNMGQMREQAVNSALSGNKNTVTGAAHAGVTDPNVKYEAPKLMDVIQNALGKVTGFFGGKPLQPQQQQQQPQQQQQQTQQAAPPA